MTIDWGDTSFSFMFRHKNMYSAKFLQLSAGPRNRLTEPCIGRGIPDVNDVVG